MPSKPAGKKNNNTTPPKKNSATTKPNTNNSSAKPNNQNNQTQSSSRQSSNAGSTVQNNSETENNRGNLVQQNSSTGQNSKNSLGNSLSNIGLNTQGESANFLGRYQSYLTSEITGSKGDYRLIKAVLFPNDVGGKIIRFMFNPTQLNFSRSVVIKDMEGAVTRAGIPKVNFAHVNPWQLKLSQILFDTYEDEKSTSVLEVIQPLLNAVDYKKFNSSTANMGNAKRPPVYYFTWGENNYLRCMVTDITYNLTMFLPNGRPVRATVDITLKEVDDSPTTPLPSSQDSSKQSQSLVNSPNTEPVSNSSSGGNQGQSQTPGSAGQGQAQPGQQGKTQPGQQGKTQPGQQGKTQPAKTQPAKKSSPSKKK